ncbi:hypothetical protein D9758_004628 [Tetrapyrgos nigripes]|uniref:Cytochrome P450 n=1 Tax=Tetrapyrgos nigripes TaxID=182062 RepID=A0A8H5LY02_9AGAR|nr:hypothetical protein D9758_004628 [Tetrapyrgos nigripes]
MTLPPGLVLLVEDVLPRVLVLPLLTFGGLKLVQYHCETMAPPSAFKFWLVALSCTQLTVWGVAKSYGYFLRRREKAALGATSPPRVQESSFQIVKAARSGRLTGYMGDNVYELTKTHGNTFILCIFGVERVITVEPEHIKAMLATQFDDFHKGPVEEDQWNSLLGSGVFNSDGDMWRFHRNMTRPFFNKVRISDFDVFDRHAEDTLSLLAERFASGTPVDFQDAIARFTLDSATEFLFGKSVDSLSAGLPYPSSHPLAQSGSENFINHPSNRFANAFANGQEILRSRGLFGKYWRFREFWKDEALQYRKIVEEFVSPILASALDNRRDDVASGLGEAKEIEDETFLEHLVKLTKDKKVIVDELLNILLAGRDTTASLLTFSIYVLTQLPNVYSRLRSEIDEKVGSRRPTYDDTRDMKYLRAFINEVLRLYPAVPFNGRMSKVSTTLPNKGGRPWYIPKDTLVIYCIFLMHRREDLWGPDALEFDPDRFLDERLQKYLTPNPFIFMPFNAGPRICLGQQFAYNEASFFLVKLIQKFTDFSLALDVQPSQPPKEWVPQPGTTKGRDKVMLTSHLTMSVRGGLWVRMKSRTEDEKVKSAEM